MGMYNDPKDHFRARAPEWRAADLEVTKARNAAATFLIGTAMVCMGFLMAIDSYVIAAGAVVSAGSLRHTSHCWHKAKLSLTQKFVFAGYRRKKPIYNIVRPNAVTAGISFGMATALMVEEYYLTAHHQLYDGIGVNAIKDMFLAMSMLCTSNARLLVRRTIIFNRTRPKGSVFKRLTRNIRTIRNSKIRINRADLLSAAGIASLLVCSSPANIELLRESFYAGTFLTPEKMAQAQQDANEIARLTAMQLRSIGADHCDSDLTAEIPQSKPGRHGLPMPYAKILVHGTCTRTAHILEIDTTDATINYYKASIPTKVITVPGRAKILMPGQ